MLLNKVSARYITASLRFMTAALRFTTMALRMLTMPVTMRPIFATVLVWFRPIVPRHSPHAVYLMDNDFIISFVLKSNEKLSNVNEEISIQV